MWIKYNPNPLSNRVGDCTIRALSKVLGQSWDVTFIAVCAYGFVMGNMPSGNEVWGAYLKRRGFVRRIIENDLTVEEFCKQHRRGRYVLAISGHVVAAIDGNYYDSFDSGQECLVFYWEERR